MEAQNLYALSETLAVGTGVIRLLAEALQDSLFREAEEVGQQKEQCRTSVSQRMQKITRDHCFHLNQPNKLEKLQKP